MTEMMRTRTLLSILLVFATLALLAACGHKGPVKPLEKALPGAVKNLRVQQFGAVMNISWSAPSANQDGSPLADLDRYDIYRMGYDPLDDCPECRDTSALILSVNPDYPEEAQLINNRFYLNDGENLVDGRGYQYRVVAVNRKGYDGSPSQVRKPFYLPPTPPAELTAEGLDRLARLSWQEPPTPDGMTLTGYRVYRGEGNAPLDPRPLTGKQIEPTNHDDFGITNGRSYRYAVRAVFVHGETELETGYSNLVRVTPGS